ncbi:MAG: polysaccharide deacetylase family protein [Actinomycetota bacterium]
MTRILCYHSVDRDWRSALAVTPEAFAGQMAWLAGHREVVPLEGAIARMTPAGGLPRGVASITFDDGYAGMAEHAVPVLRRLRLPASLFVVTGSFDGSAGPERWLDERDRPETPVGVVGEETVRSLAAEGWSIGSHSHTHRDLTELGEDECERDLRTSRDVLESILGGPAAVLAYPRGRHAAHVRRAARRAGFRYALSLPEEPAPAGDMAIPRVGIYRGDGVGALRLKLSRWYLPFRTSPAFPVARRVARAVRGGS